MAANATPRKRSKRNRENSEFDAFTRRIIRAFARRVAGGDIEALPALLRLQNAVDSAVEEAVKGLRSGDRPYSWQDIASRLGVSRQAAQMRFGKRSERIALDERLVREGLGVSVATLVAVFADHFPGSPMPSRCPGCGYRYPDGVTDCPTMITIRPVLYRRRGEDPTAVKTLTADQHASLHDPKAARKSRAAAARQAKAPCPNREPELTLFDNLGGEDTTP
ncbi:hypothetical protein [Catenuloplanes atrovinosus]|uniref:Ribosomal protein S20 n=1 Tax=Catenuloplanes atrovinosus TaxID=137266 RepID=A0AAE3YKQ8_9ACTN|nr:hypothetical protein [Catenuloplanes atrovinosus]MDR7273606.1 ribosomal protein S20 [Catenuloplanes atrovinosus]